MEDKKLKIVFISSWYPNRTRPYLGIFVKRHAEAIAKSCHVAAVYACSGESAGVEVKTENGVLTIISYYKKPLNKIPFFGKIVTAFRYLLAWKKAINHYKKENGKPDIIHANVVFPASIFATWYSFKWKVPYLITEHWSGYFPKDGRYKGFILKWVSSMAVRRASAMVTVSAALMKNMQAANLRNTYYVISNIVDNDTFSLSEKSLSNSVRFIHTSFPDGDRKNVPGIIRAFDMFHANHKDSTLTLIAGEEKDTTELKQLCESLRLNDAVRFLLPKPKKDLAGLLHNSDAFILFSEVETQGVVLLEALCCGLPVISSRCGAPEDFITPENGLLVDVGNEQQLSDAMNTFAINKNSYNPVAIRNSVIDMVSEDNVRQKFLQVYRDILKKK
jgi:glycosyltransferase involved in cell wall biosynthesis